MRYLVLGQDGSIGAYERVDVLMCDLTTNETPQMIWRRTNELRARFIPSSVDEIYEDLEVSRTQIIHTEAA